MNDHTLSHHTAATTSPRDSRSWWAATRDDAGAFSRWLLDQYRGEVTAADRIEALAAQHAAHDPRARRVLATIASQERAHARWVAALLQARGLDPVVQDKADRYWQRTLPGIHDLETGCAVGAHAERMRLERIEAIAADPGAPPDVRDTFRRILRDERFHERAFRKMAGPKALEATRDAHDLGRNALGLTP